MRDEAKHVHLRPPQGGSATVTIPAVFTNGSEKAGTANGTGCTCERRKRTARATRDGNVATSPSSSASCAAVAKKLVDATMRRTWPCSESTWSTPL